MRCSDCGADKANLWTGFKHGRSLCYDCGVADIEARHGGHQPWADMMHDPADMEPLEKVSTTPLIVIMAITFVVGVICGFTACGLAH